MIQTNPADILGAVHAFISEFVWQKPDLIVRGWQNRSALPAHSDYAVLTLIGINRRGTNAHKYGYAKDGNFSVQIQTLNIFDVQVDFCGTDENLVTKRAILLNSLVRDKVACDFFRKHNLSSLYADDPKALPFVDNLNQWCVRYSEVYRRLLFWKALANISTAVMASLNNLIYQLFGKHLVLYEWSVMSLELYIFEPLQAFERAILANYGTMNRGAGVGFNYVEIPSPTFGFNEADYEPFNISPFDR